MAEGCDDGGQLMQLLRIDSPQMTRRHENGGMVLRDFLARSLDDFPIRRNHNSFGLFTNSVHYEQLRPLDLTNLTSVTYEPINAAPCGMRANEYQVPVDELMNLAAAAQSKAKKTPAEEDAEKAAKENEQALKWAQDHILELERQIAALKENRTCKVCMDHEVSHVFIPCGHAICCGQCVGNVKKCPMCRAHIQGSLIAYFS